MTRARSLGASLLSLSTAAILALAGAGSATATPSSTDEKSALTVASAKVDSTGVAEYWTSERMRAAIPGDVLAAKALERSNASSPASVEKGAPTKVKATKGKPTLAVREAPVRHIGKVFFTMGGTNYVCSGNAVSSANRSTVATAGHCVHDATSGKATYFMFVPAYENGDAPYGKWTAHDLYAPTLWTANGDMQYDTGFAVMNPRADEALLTDVVGGSGVAFNQDPGLTYTAYGYPAARPFDGTSLWSCTGTATADTKNPQFNTQGIPCDMTGGSSGGPWLTATTEGTVQNSINSYGYKGSAVMYGPHWGVVIEQTYNAASIAATS